MTLLEKLLDMVITEYGMEDPFTVEMAKLVEEHEITEIELVDFMVAEEAYRKMGYWDYIPYKGE